jgi:hypothetical protein
MKSLIKCLGLGLLTFSLVACNENDDDNIATPTIPPKPPQTLTVQPSLGQVFNGSVTLSTTKGQLIQTQKLNSAGQAKFTLPDELPVPFVFKMCGGQGIKYFDEALQQSVDLPPEFCLRAIVSDRQLNTVAMSVLSESVVRYFEANGGLNAVTAIAVKMRYEDFADKLAISHDMSLMPTQVGTQSHLKALIERATSTATQAAQQQKTKQADQYAYRLAALALSARVLAQHRGLTQGFPALEMANGISSDLIDAKLDGKNQQNYIVSAFYDGLQLNNLLAYTHGVYLKSVLGDGFLEQDLGTQAGQKYLQDKGLILPPVLPVVRSTPDDSLLSWQGRYLGKWYLGQGVDVGKDFAAFLPSVYKNYMTHLVEGASCQVDIMDDQITVDGLAFTIDSTVKALPNELGQRRYLIKRVDTEGLVKVEANGVLITQADELQELNFTVKAQAFPFALDAQLSCKD